MFHPRSPNISGYTALLDTTLLFAKIMINLYGSVLLKMWTFKRKHHVIILKNSSLLGDDL